MPDFSQLIRDKPLSDILVWAAVLIAVWLSSPWIRKAMALMLWQLYDLFIGKPP